MIDVIQLLKENKNVEDFRVIFSSTTSHETFFVHKKLETIRATETEDCSVTVYVQADGKMGDSTFAVYSSMTEEEVKKRIESGIKRASLVKNKPYSLVEGGVESHELTSNFSDFTPEELSAKIADAVFFADCYQNGSINALEIFVYEEKVRVVNSRGVDKTQIKHRAMIEAIPTWNTENESVELYEAHHFTHFDRTSVTKEIDAKMQEVRDRMLAKKLDGPATFDVLLNAPEISSLLREILSDCNYSTVYSHANVRKMGDFIQENATGDLLSVTMKREVKGSRFSAHFDEDGVTLQDKKVVDQGKIVGLYGSNRFGQYLQEIPTGNLRCIGLEKGTLSSDELAKKTYFECVSLSGLQVDLYNDYIGGEIRLGYIHENGEKTPVTGISMSGRLSEALKTIRLADVCLAKDAYDGPAFALLKDISIV